MAEDWSLMAANDAEYSTELFLRQHVTYLQHVLRDTVARGQWIQNHSLEEIKNRADRIEELEALNVSYIKQGQLDRVALAMTRRDRGRAEHTTQCGCCN
ncbi:hypothetical protein VTN00DRAFT_2344 [Thermoascus crustaceus]|uniref:uncharacterized protein n=1 Tax=Thermoascus crustaceus TaxID=5088 RepID=UPI003742BD98